MGGGGFTVDRVTQMERFGNLRVSEMSVNTDFGDLRRLTLYGYDAELKWFIDRAVPITRMVSYLRIVIRCFRAAIGTHPFARFQLICTRRRSYSTFDTRVSCYQLPPTASAISRLTSCLLRTLAFMASAAIQTTLAR